MIWNIFKQKKDVHCELFACKKNILQVHVHCKLLSSNLHWFFFHQ